MTSSLFPIPACSPSAKRSSVSTAMTPFAARLAMSLVAVACVQQDRARVLSQERSRSAGDPGRLAELDVEPDALFATEPRVVVLHDVPVLEDLRVLGEVGVDRTSAAGTSSVRIRSSQCAESRDWNAASRTRCSSSRFFQRGYPRAKRRSSISSSSPRARAMRGQNFWSMPTIMTQRRSEHS